MCVCSRRPNRSAGLPACVSGRLCVWRGHATARVGVMTPRAGVSGSGCEGTSVSSWCLGVRASSAGQYAMCGRALTRGPAVGEVSREGTGRGSGVDAVRPGGEGARRGSRNKGGLRGGVESGDATRRGESHGSGGEGPRSRAQGGVGVSGCTDPRADGWRDATRGWGFGPVRPPPRLKTDWDRGGSWAGPSVARWARPCGGSLFRRPSRTDMATTLPSQPAAARVTARSSSGGPRECDLPSTNGLQKSLRFQNGPVGPRTHRVTPWKRGSVARWDGDRAGTGSGRPVLPWMTLYGRALGSDSCMEGTNFHPLPPRREVMAPILSSHES